MLLSSGKNTAIAQGLQPQHLVFYITHTKEWFGDTMDEFPAATHTRFLLQNCNGLSTANDCNFFKSSMTEIISKDIHFLALPEINVNCINVNITNGYKEAFVNITNNGVFNATNTPIFDSNTKYQPGGVGSGFFGQLTSRYIRQSKDKYGRWHSHDFQGRERNLRVYTLYRVNYSTDQTTGPTTAWAQQRLLLTQDGIYDNPRHKVINDLLSEITKGIQSGCSIIVLADLNEYLDGNEKN